ncbi:DnaB-like helicase N-terminal domain-containing protein [Kitasatospora aureofaciens]|uniref:DnaB-like helicase N-terminal domain-containing protein n=1 Tax=Kitasatospora aureofaciens TaxID=1894 RepID=UPI0005278AA6|nr:DnaB-like helicase N-terminal domain-containing protein [Kitasatospora aureofaciens]
MSAPASAYAEAALLGAILQDPRRALEVRDWIRAEDFDSFWDQEIYRALTDHGLYARADVLSQPAHLRSAALQRAVLDQLYRTAAVQGWPMSAQAWQEVAAYVAHLPLPHNVPDAANAASYGRVVAQASLERTVGVGGELAERAVLAAVLARPEEAQRLKGWLKSTDFTDPAYGQMYRVLVEESLASHPAVTIRRPEERTQVLAKMLYQQLQHKAAVEGWGTPQELWPVVAHQIRDMTSVHRVPHPERAAQLGQRVLQSSIQRLIAASGDMVERTLDHPGALAASTRINETLALLQRLEDRWEQAMGRPEGAGASLPPAARPRTPEFAFTEDAVLGSLLRDPGQVEGVRTWLRAQDFTQPGRAELYSAIVRAVDSGGAIDPVLVVWDAHRRSADPQAMDADTVWSIYQRGEPGLARSGAKQLVEATIVHHVRSATAAISQAAGDPAAAPGMVIGTARGHLQHASAQAARLALAQQSTGPVVWAR